MIAFPNFRRRAAAPGPARRHLPAPFMRLDDARHIVTHPELYAHRPILRRLAWAALMQARGQRINHRRLSHMPVQGAT